MNKNLDRFHGTYYFFGIALEVREGDRGLESAMIGVPAGYEIGLEPAGENAFRMRGGPLNGAVVTFLIGETGTARAMKAGGFELGRVDPDTLGDLEMVERLIAPVFDLDREKERAFEELCAREVLPAAGRRIDYRLPYPKSEFVRYLMEKDEFIFHGSGDTEIEVFRPVRTSVEMFDPEERGNLPAVYGTHDALWAMFFAVVDRGRLDGSIRNGVMYVHNRKGEPLALYNFSINRDNLPDRPYHTGALYFLPRDTFVRQSLAGAAANEWASLEPVRPLASLLVDPDDFPFLDRISGHDDGPLVRAQALQRQLMEAAVETSADGPDRRAVFFRADPELEALMGEYIALQRSIMPGMVYRFEPGPPPALRMEQIPPAMIQVLDAEFERRGLV